MAKINQKIHSTHTTHSTHATHSTHSTHSKYSKYILPFTTDSIDTAHLLADSLYKNSELYKNLEITAPTLITHATMMKLAQLCSFKLDKEIILFGIRGAELPSFNAISQINTWSDHLTITGINPDHQTPKCVIGIWNQRTKMLCAYKGSTVPNAKWMDAQLNSQARVANLLGQGLHAYYIGPHEPAGSIPHEGAWRLNSLIDVGVWRLRDASQNHYSLSCEFDACFPGDNIHSTYSSTYANSNTDSNTDSNDNIQFSSSGCQTITGDHSPPNIPEGDFQNFRINANQSAIPDANQVGIAYDYILTSNVYLNLIQNHHFNEIRFMQGSTSPVVRLIQDKLVSLKFLEDQGFNKGHYNGKTAKAVYDFQVHHHILADGIIKPSDLKHLGISSI